PDLEIVAQDPSGSTAAIEITDQLGMGNVPLPSGDFRFYVEVSGTRFWSGPPGHCAIPGDCRTATIQVRPVVVTVADTAGHPVADQEVLALGTSGGVMGSGVTDATGVVQLFLNENQYVFTTFVGSVQFSSSPQLTCTVPGCYAASITVNVPVVVSVV